MQAVDRLVLAAAALALAIGTAAAAASAHVDDAVDARRLGSAAQMLLTHGVGLLGLALARRSWPRLARPLGWTAALIAVGLLLFGGSLLLAAFFDTSTAAAPFGGGLIILGWLAVVLSAVLSRQDDR